jgi:hypothetical protein
MAADSATALTQVLSNRYMTSSQTLACALVQLGIGMPVAEALSRVLRAVKDQPQAIFADVSWRMGGTHPTTINRFVQPRVD